MGVISALCALCLCVLSAWRAGPGHLVKRVRLDGAVALLGLDLVEEDAREEETGALVERVADAVHHRRVATGAHREVGVEEEEAGRHRPDVVEGHASEATCGRDIRQSEHV